MSITQDLPTITLPRWYHLASRLPSVDESPATEEARRFILEHARREMNAVGIANLLFIAASMYVGWQTKHGIDPAEARTAGGTMATAWAEVIVEDETIRQAALHELDRMVAQAQRPRQ